MSRCVYDVRVRYAYLLAGEEGGKGFTSFYNTNAAFLTRKNALKDEQRRIYPRNSILHRHAELGVSGKNSLRRPPQSHPPRQNWQSWWSWFWQTGWCLTVNSWKRLLPPSSAYLDRCAVSALRQKLASYTGVRDVFLELLHFSRSSLVAV